jgi:hypothetical protein
LQYGSVIVVVDPQIPAGGREPSSVPEPQTSSQPIVQISRSTQQRYLRTTSSPCLTSLQHGGRHFGFEMSTVPDCAIWNEATRTTQHLITLYIGNLEVVIELMYEY